MMLIKFEGATAHEDDEGRTYTPRGPIWLNPVAIAGVYDHTVLMVGGSKIRVMEDLPTILERLRG